MADQAKHCDDKCGCPVPCPGGTTCKCVETGGGAGSEQAHTTCSCGDHCGCSPCTCRKVTSTGTGRSNCTCGTGCNCETCKA